jgi:hypothetical protein
VRGFGHPGLSERFRRPLIKEADTGEVFDPLLEIAPVAGGWEAGVMECDPRGKKLR